MPLSNRLGRFLARFCEKFSLLTTAVGVGIGALVLGAATTDAQTYTDLHDFTPTEMSTNYPSPDIMAQGRDGNLYFGGAYGCGSIFKMTPSGTVTVVYDFNADGGANGCDPGGGLTLGTDGNFYGVTYSGGSHSYGTIYKVTPAGVLTVLHHFDGTQNQYYSWAPPVQGKNGTFYGITGYGAAYSITSSAKYKLLNPDIGGTVQDPLTFASDGNLYGVISGFPFSYGYLFRLSPNGAVKILYSFDFTHGSFPRGALVQGTDGLLYGASANGGAYGYGTIFKMTLTGSFTVLHDITGTVDSGECAGPVAASDGKIYSALYGGGAQYLGTLYQITKTGAYSTLYSFDNTHGANPYATPMQHTNGIIYGVAAVGGASNRGVAYSLNNSLPRFVALMTITGAAGQTLQILGTGLTGTTSVKFGSGSASFNVVSDSYMTATVPANGTSDYVTVVTPSGTLTSNKQYKITPVISSFSPQSGPVGTQVTITGSGFIGAKQVSFGGVKATSYTVDPSGTSIKATVPAGAKTGKIAIKTAGGNASSKTKFTVT